MSFRDFLNSDVPTTLRNKAKLNERLLGFFILSPVTNHGSLSFADILSKRCWTSNLLNQPSLVSAKNRFKSLLVTPDNPYRPCNAKYSQIRR